MLPDTYRKLTAVRHDKDFRAAVAIQTVALDAPKAGEIVIKNLFAGVNASDVMMAAGQYLLPTPVPCDMGAEALGEVVAVGDGVETVRVGDFVLSTAIGAGYREYYTTKARRVMVVPAASAGVMSLSIAGLTARVALHETAEMKSGETVLVTAAAGGTGLFAVQIAKLAGNHVIGTCSSDDKATLLKSLGCDRVVNYKRESLRDVLKAEYPKGVDVVFESVGGDLFDTALDHLALFGRMITLGFITEYKENEPERVNKPRVYYKLLAKNASVRGFNLNLHFGRPALAEHLAWLVEMMQSGALKAQIDPTHFAGVEGAIDAVEYLHAGKNSGKVVVSF